MKRIAIALFAVGLLGGTAVMAQAGSTPTPNGVFSLPKHSVITLSNATFQACDDLRYGYQLNGGPLTLVGSKAVGCTPGSNAAPTSGGTIGPFKTNTTVRLWLLDDSCGDPNVTYYSDHTSTGTASSVDHATVTGTNPWTVELSDAGGGCATQDVDRHKGDTDAPVANLTVTVTRTSPRPAGV